MESRTEGSNSENFIQWAQSVRIFICGKGKEEYLTGAIVQPKEDDPGYRTWKLENSMVMSWLINSMTNDIGENFMYYGTAKEIWDAARETYSNIDNTSAISKSRVFSKIFDEEIQLLPNILISLHGIGNNSIFMKNWFGSVLKMDSYTEGH
ncbi:hypothetical protein CK203_034218 [Vitis vinifera]|uniref:Retrotransposon Copia-like N-terminal domain-containing protein n=1 Tax=Vitis vinifera TaxID=29760 RepID=A0A438IF19_VITVI|nr:hypothetical protein CK203_034218 [Vitis vinifera]